MRIYVEKYFKDDGYFSSINPLKRILVAENTYDLGEYLVNLHQSGELKTSFLLIYPKVFLKFIYLIVL